MDIGHKRTGDALSRGLDFWFLAAVVTLLVAFVYEPIQQYGAALIGSPVLVGLLAAAVIYFIKSER